MNSNIIEHAIKLAILNNIGASVVDARNLDLLDEALFAHLPSYLSEIKRDLDSMFLGNGFYDYLTVRELNDALEAFLSHETVIRIHHGTPAIISAETRGNSLKTEVVLPDLSFFKYEVASQSEGLEDSFENYEFISEINSSEVVLSTGDSLSLSALIIPKVKLMELFQIRNIFITKFYI